MALPPSPEKSVVRSPSRYLPFIVLLLLFALYQTANEIRFSVWGIKARAVAVVLDHLPSQDGTDPIEVQFQFIDSDGHYHQIDQTTDQRVVETARATDGTVEIVYLFGSPDQIKLSNQRMASIWVLLILALPLALLTLALLGVRKYHLRQLED